MQQVSGTVVPGRVVGGLDHVVANSAGKGDKGDVGDFVADILEVDSERPCSFGAVLADDPLNAEKVVLVFLSKILRLLLFAIVIFVLVVFIFIINNDFKLKN